MNEFEFGELTGTKLTLRAWEERHFQRPNEVDATNVEAKAKQVTQIVREYNLVEDGNAIEFTIHLGVGGREPELHLQGKLQKQVEP